MRPQKLCPGCSCTAGWLAGVRIEPRAPWVAGPRQRGELSWSCARAGRRRRWGLRWVLMTSLGWVWVGWGGTEIGVRRSCFLSWCLSLGVGWGGRGPLRRVLVAGSPAESAASAEVQSAAHQGLGLGCGPSGAGSRGGGGESFQALPVPCPPRAEWVDLEGSVGQGPDHSLWTVSVKMLGEVAPGSEATLSGMLAALGGIGLVPAPSD